MKKLIILIPVYNVAKYIVKTLQSFLIQDCNCFDVLLINDGSSDNIKEVVDGFKEKFKQKNINITMIDKENGGAASAINVGLKQKLNYEYILIMDGDDWLTKKSISQRIEFLEKNKDYDCIIGATNIVDEKSGIIIEKNIASGITENKEETFWNIFNAKGVVFTGYIFRLKKLLSLLKDGQIYESHGGQNWQLLLPISYNCKIKVISQETLNYLIREQSHSHSVTKQYDDFAKRHLLHKEILENTFDTIGIKEKYQNVINYKCYRQMLNLAFRYKKKKDFMAYYKEVKKLKKITFKDFVKKWYLRLLVRG